MINTLSTGRAGHGHTVRFWPTTVIGIVDIQIPEPVAQ